MTTPTEALKLALDLATMHHTDDGYAELRSKVRQLAKEALAQPEHEPVGEAYLCDRCQTPFDGAYECPSCGHNEATKEPVYTTPPPVPTAQPKQEPKKDLMFATVAMQEREDKRIENIVATLEKIKQEQLAEKAQPKPLKHDWMRDHLGMSEESGFFSREAMKAHSDGHPKEPEQEPVGYTDPQTIRLLKDPTASGLVTDQLTRHKHDPIRGVQIPLYTSPPQRKPLTDEQAELLIENSDGRWCLVSLAHYWPLAHWIWTCNRSSNILLNELQAMRKIINKTLRDLFFPLSRLLRETRPFSPSIPQTPRNNAFCDCEIQRLAKDCRCAGKNQAN